jgi:hypothetical protein
MKAENLAIDAIRGSALSSLADIPRSMEFLVRPELSEKFG